MADSTKSDDENFDFLYKVVVTGDSGVGKTNIITRFTANEFSLESKATIGVEFGHAEITLGDGTKIKVQIWDTAGQERFRTITTAYYRGAMGILLVYDVTDERSFNNIRNWIRNIEQHASEGVNKILIGNKCDVLEKKVISKEQGQALANEFGIKFLETSAKSSTGVEDAFLSLARDIKKRLIDSPETTEKTEKKSDNIDLKEKPTQKSGGCC